MTPKQKKILEFIQARLALDGHPPSQREIAQAFRFHSLGTVQNYLVRLEREGLLHREWNARRGLRPLGAVPAGGRLPLAGTVAAGRPIEAVETSDSIEVPSSMLGAGDNFVLKVRGDSMVEDGILDGDFVVVRRQPRAESGQTVVALLDGEATVKRLFREEDRLELRPAHPSMPPIVVKDTQQFRIVGVVVGVIRHCG